MKHLSFNVLSEPWIPVVDQDGSREELGILPCLERSHELLEIRDPSPVIEFGLYRLLVAFVLDALVLAGCRPEHYLDLNSLIEAGRFDMNLLNDYVEQCGDVFDLFHPERPFLQVKMEESKPKSIAGLFPVLPSGVNVIHWHHQQEESISVSKQEAARLLTTVAPFTTAGGAGLSPSINGAPGIYALPVGNNIFETVTVNIPLRADQESGNGAAAWRSTRLPGEKRKGATAAEALTWRPRKIQLVPGDRVVAMKFEKGDSADFDWRDANLAYQFTEKKVIPIRMRENRPLWRDAGPLSILKEDQRGAGSKRVVTRRPEAVDNAFHLLDEAVPVRIKAYGLRTDGKMKFFEWASSEWVVPAELGRSTRLGAVVVREIERAESASYSLRDCIELLFPGQRTRKGEARKAISDRSERTFWQRLEPVFRPMLDAFAKLHPDAPDGPDLINAAAEDWRQTIRRLALEQFELAVEDMDSDGDALERQVRARMQMHERLKEVLS